MRISESLSSLALHPARTPFRSFSETFSLNFYNIALKSELSLISELISFPLVSGEMYFYKDSGTKLLNSSLETSFDAFYMKFFTNYTFKWFSFRFLICSVVLLQLKFVPW
jgi:hypothetical protein